MRSLMRLSSLLIAVVLAITAPVIAAGEYTLRTVTVEQAQSAADLALAYARAGVPYKLAGHLTLQEFQAGTVEGGVDASGLVVNVYREVLGEIRWAGGGGEDPLLLADIASATFFNWNTLPVRVDDLCPGDLLFFKNASGRISGVGLFLEKDGDLVHYVVASANKGRVIKTFLNTKNQSWHQSFAGAGRLTYWQK